MSNVSPEERQAIVDDEHLRILAICHYVLGGLVICFSCLAIIYILVGLAMAISPQFSDHPRQPHEAPPAVFGYVVAGMGGCFMCLGWAVGGAMIFMGRSIQKRQHRTLTLVMAAIECLSMPFGTLLGVFTFIVLLRPSVILLYQAQANRAVGVTP